MRELIGYYDYTVPLEQRVELLNIFLNHDFELYHEREDEETFSFRLCAIGANKVEKTLREEGITLVRGPMRGLFGVGKKLVRHPGLLVGILISTLMYFWLTGMVWEVRIISASNVEEDRVRSILGECGLREGIWIGSLNVDELVSSYLLKDDAAAFAAIHLNGVVAEVELIQKESKTIQENARTPCNIVAARDAVITDVTVYAGKGLVRIGHTVAEGDLLVSGVITDLGGTRIVRAVADVRGEVEDTIEIAIPLNNEKEKVVSRKLAGVALRVFDRTVTFGDTVSKGHEKICEQQQIYLFGRIRLPITVMVYRDIESVREPVLFTESMAERMAGAQLRERLSMVIGDGTLLTRTITTETKGGVYTLRCHVVYESNIAKSIAFSTENQ